MPSPIPCCKVIPIPIGFGERLFRFRDLVFGFVVVKEVPLLTFRLMVLISATFGLLPWLSAQPNDWPRPEGPNGDGTLTATGFWQAWDFGKPEVVWKLPVGGAAPPLVHGGKVFAVGRGRAGSGRFQLLSVDAAKGTVLWQLELPLASRGLPTSPSLDLETGNLYVHGGDGVLYCIDPNGKLLWRKDFQKRFGALPRAARPRLMGSLVLFPFHTRHQSETGAVSYRLCALDKISGEAVWLRTVPAPSGNLVEPLLVRGEESTRLFLVSAKGTLLEWSPHSGVGLAEHTLSGPVTELFLADSDHLGCLVGRAGERKFQLVTLDGAVATFDHHLGSDRVAGVLRSGTSLHLLLHSGELATFDLSTGSKERSLDTKAVAGKVYLIDEKIVVADPAGRLIVVNQGESPDVVTLYPDQGLAGIVGAASAYGRLFCLGHAGFYAFGAGIQTAQDSSFRIPIGSVAEPGSKAAFLQVRPPFATLVGNQSMDFQAWTISASGRPIRQVQATWTQSGGLDVNHVGGVKAAKPGIAKLEAKVGNLKAVSTVRVVRPVPWKLEFEEETAVPEDWYSLAEQPLSFLSVEEVSGGKALLWKAEQGSSGHSLHLGPVLDGSFRFSCDFMPRERSRFQPVFAVHLGSATLTIDPGSKRFILYDGFQNPVLSGIRELQINPRQWYRLTIDVRRGNAGSEIIATLSPREGAEKSVRIQGVLTGDRALGNLSLSLRSFGDILFDRMSLDPWSMAAAPGVLPP